MEIHAHPHSPRKKWTHYFWEFLMLFLAVFCGFWAEYQLEHKIEKDRARQYIVSFYQDLKTDTSEFARLTAIDKTKLAALSDVYPCYDTVIKNPASSSCLEHIVWNSLSFIDLINTDRTLQQLKNAGGMRMLNNADADSIYAYDNRLRRYLSFENSLFQERQTNLRNMYIELLSYPDMMALRTGTDSLLNGYRKQFILSASKDQLNKLFNQLSEYTLGLKTRLTFITGLNEAANRLLQYFETKYNLEK